MAINFKNVKSTALDLTSTIRVGKFSGCRVCDIIEEDYEYLIWANRSGLLQYTKPVIAKLHQLAAFAAEEEFFNNEVAPYLEEDYTRDVPF